MFNILATELTAWQEAGVFFSHSVFGVLGSVLVVSKVKDWCISVSPKKIGELVTEIDAELQIVGRAQVKNEGALESVADHYKNSKEQANKLSSDLKKWNIGFFIGFYLFVLGCAGTDVWLICSGNDKSWGLFSLLLLLPLPIARGLSYWYYNSKDTQTEECLSDFRKKRFKYQKTYIADEAAATKPLKQFDEKS